jgi:hypothetical protein
MAEPATQIAFVAEIDAHMLGKVPSRYMDVFF